MMPGTFKGEGAASKATNLGNNLRAVLPCVANQGGVSILRKGPHSTLFCGLENINVLCTTPVPDCMLDSSWPGNAPHVVVPNVKPAPAQYLIPTVPYLGFAIARSTAA